MKIDWKIKKIKLSDLHEYAENPRILTKKGLQDLKKSIQKFGCCEPLVINTDNIICGGHGRKKILEELGIDFIDCYIPSLTLTDNEFKELNIRLNKNIAGKFDSDILCNFDIDFLLDIGFTDVDLGIDIKNEDDITHFSPNIIPETKYSDITREQIHNEAKKLASQMLKENSFIDCVCPKCGEEFQIGKI